MNRQKPSRKPSKEELEHAYHNLKMTRDKLCEYFNCSQYMINKLFKLYQMRFRSNSESHTGIAKKDSKSRNIDPQWLSMQYTKQTVNDIASEVGVSPTHIYRLLKLHGIPLRPPKYRTITKKTLEHYYYELKMSQSQIGKQLNCSTATIGKLFKQHGLVGRSNKDSHLAQSATISKNMQRLWRDPNYVNKMLGSHPTIKHKMNALAANQLGRISKIQKILYSILDDLKIQYQPEATIGHYSFDCLLPDHNILIECQGDYWHSLPKAVAIDKAKATYINRYYPDYRLICIWEHEFFRREFVSDLMRYLVKMPYSTINFKLSCVSIKEVPTSDAEIFVSKYHYAGRIGKGTINYGAFLENELIAICTFSPITRLESATRIGCAPRDIRELSRFCIHPQYHKKNLASWVISRCIQAIHHRLDIKMLISFADETFNHTGTIYKASNWIYDGIVRPSYWYISQDNYAAHKKTIWDHAKKLGLSESQYAEKYGYRKIDGKIKHRYIYRLRRNQ